MRIRVKRFGRMVSCQNVNAGNKVSEYKAMVSGRNLTRFKLFVLLENAIHVLAVSLSSFLKNKA